MYFSSSGTLRLEQITFPAMVTFLIAFSIADVIITNIGLSIGCIELNSFVLSAGLGLWGAFRIALLCYLASVFLWSYRYFHKRSKRKALTALRIGLLVLDIYIGIVIVSNVFALLVKMA